MNAFSDEPIVPGVTAVKAQHINELRTAIRAAAALVSQTPAFTNDPLPAGASITVAEVDELRTALTNVFSALQLPVPTFTDPSLIPGTTYLKSADIEELRNALK